MKLLEVPTVSIIDNQSFGKSPTLIHKSSIMKQGFVMDNQFQDRTQIKKNTYTIVDLAWLINLKLKDASLGEMADDESHLCIISYNPCYSNLKLSLYNFMQKEAASDYHINISMCNRITQATLSSESALEILYNIESKTSEDIKNVSIVERVITSWKPNQSNILISKDDIVLKTKFRDISYSFTFLNWQIEAFKKCLEFTASSDAWFANLQAILIK